MGPIGCWLNVFSLRVVKFGLDGWKIAPNPV